MNKYTPPISTKIDSQPWMIWHKDIGSHLGLANVIKSQKINEVNDKLNYNINGAMMNIQYYGPSSNADTTIKVGLPVQCKNRSIVDMYYSDGSSTTIIIQPNDRSFTIPINTKELDDKSVHIQGNVFIVT